MPIFPRTTRVAPRVRLWVPVAAYAAAIFAVSSVSVTTTHPPPVNDKAVHGLLYGGFALVWLRALGSGAWTGVTVRTAVAAVAAATMYGATDELHQRLVPGRLADVRDLLADFAGAAIAVAIVLAWRRIGPSRRAGTGPRSATAFHRTGQSTRMNPP